MLAVGLVTPSHFLAWSVLFALAAMVGTLFRRQRSMDPVVLFLLALAGITALQLVPMPPAVLHLLSPSTAELRAVLPDPGHAHPLTLDVSATIAEVAKYLAYASVAVVGITCVQSASGRRRLARWLVIAVGAFALVAIVHTLGGADRIWWSYRQERETIGLIKATLVNRNHIAAVLGAGVPLTLAVAIREHRPWRQILLALGALELVLALLTLSRGGAAATIVGVVVVVLGLRRGHARGRGGRPIVALAVVSGLAAATLIASSRFLGVVEESQAVGVLRDPKSMLWDASLGLIRAHWLTGVGRGTFPLAMPRFLIPDLTAEATFHYSENLLLQWAAEWGVPVALLALGALGVWLVRAFRLRGSSSLRTGALSSLLVLLIHDLADFSLEMPAIAGLGVLFACVASPVKARADQAPARGYAPILLMAGLLLAPLVLSSPVLRHQYRPESERLTALLGGTARTLPREAAAIAGRHPMDWAVHLLLGEWHARRRRPEAMVWFNRAMQLNPRGGAIHFAVGRALLRSGLVSQGLMELRLAQREAPRRSRDIAEVAARAAPSYSQLRTFIGTGRLSGARALLVAEILHRKGLARDYEQVTEYLAARREPVLRDAGLAGLVEIHAGRGEHERAMALAHRLAAARPAASVLARVLAVTSRIGTTDEHARLQERALAAHAEDPGLLFVAAEDALRRRDAASARRFADALRAVSGTDATISAHARMVECEAALLDGHPVRAGLAAERGLADSPENAALLDCHSRATRAAEQARKSRRFTDDLDGDSHP